jgi:hypothetical protein
MKFRFLLVSFAMSLLVSSIVSAKELTVQDIRERLEIRADVYTMDKTGRRVLESHGSSNYYRPNEKGEITNDWSSNTGHDVFAIRHNWIIQDDGTIKVTMEEFAKDENPKTGATEFLEPLAKKEFIIENFTPITWKFSNIKDKNKVARFIPYLREERKPMQVEKLPLAGADVTVTDSEGYLWADEVNFSEKYVGLSTHRGTLALSFVPFKGSEEVGRAEENKVILKFNPKYTVTLISRTSFLPTGLTAKVYAAYKPERRTSGVRSVHIFTTDTENRFLEKLNK